MMLFSLTQSAMDTFPAILLNRKILKHTHTCTHFHPFVAPSDYVALTNFRLGPFSNDVRELSYNVSIVNDSIPEDSEMFRATLTLEGADQAELVTVSPDEADVTIQDNDGRQSLLTSKTTFTVLADVCCTCILTSNTTLTNVLAILSMYYYINIV